MCSNYKAKNGQSALIFSYDNKEIQYVNERPRTFSGPIKTTEKSVETCGLNTQFRLGKEITQTEIQITQPMDNFASTVRQELNM